MPNVTKCQIHIPHKDNWNDWAEQLGQLLFPDDPVKRDRLRLVARGDSENWRSVERFINEMGPICFSGDGCGTPSSVRTIPNGNVVDGEDACAEGRNNTVHGDKSTIGGGEDNSIDANSAESHIAGGNSNVMTNSPAAFMSGTGNTLDSSQGTAVIGNLNNVQGMSNSLVVGDSNAPTGGTECLIVGDNNVIEQSTVQSACIGTNNRVTFAGNGPGYVQAFGIGAVGWLSGSVVQSGQNGSFDTTYDGWRTVGQGSRFDVAAFTDHSTATQDIFSNAIPYFPLLPKPFVNDVEMRLTAIDPTGQLVSVWQVSATVYGDGTGARLVGVPTVILVRQDAGAVGWTVGAVSVVPGPGAPFDNILSMNVTADPGAGNPAVQWYGYIEMVENYTS